MLGYILGLLKGFKYLRKTGDLIGDNLTLRLLRRTFILEAPCKSTEDAEHKLRGLILTVGNKVRKLWVELHVSSKNSLRVELLSGSCPITSYNRFDKYRYFSRILTI